MLICFRTQLSDTFGKIIAKLLQAIEISTFLENAIISKQQKIYHKKTINIYFLNSKFRFLTVMICLAKYDKLDAIIFK